MSDIIGQYTSFVCAVLYTCRLLGSCFHVFPLKKSTVMFLFVKMFNQWLFLFLSFVIVLIHLVTGLPGYSVLSVIILMINKSDSRLMVVQFC